MTIACHCYLQGRPAGEWCGSCSRNEYQLACLERSLTPRQPPVATTPAEVISEIDTATTVIEKAIGRPIHPESPLGKMFAEAKETARWLEEQGIAIGEPIVLSDLDGVYRSWDEIGKGKR